MIVSTCLGCINVGCTYLVSSAVKSVLLATLLQKSVRETSGVDVVRLEKLFLVSSMMYYLSMYVYVMVIDPCCIHL